MRARTAASLLGLGLLLAGSAGAQEVTFVPPPPRAATATPSSPFQIPPALPPLAQATGQGGGAQPGTGGTRDPGRGMGGPGMGTGGDTGASSEQSMAQYGIELEPPGPNRLFRLESEKQFQQRLRREARERPGHPTLVFPPEPPVSTQQFAQRAFPPATEIVEPHYVCYGRLLFEDINSERYGWDLGFIQPFVSVAKFYCDTIFLPYHIGTEPCRKYECSAGYCLPGDPVPYLLYPPELSVTGALFEAGTIVSLFAIFPG